MKFLNWLVNNWEVLSGISALLGGIFMWFKNNKKRKIDLDSQSTSILSTQLNLIKTMMDEEKQRNTLRIQERDAEIESYKKEKKEFEKTIEALTLKVETLIEEIKKLEKLVNGK